MGASCPAPWGSRGDEGQLPMAPGRGLGLAAGRRRDRMTVSNLIRHKLHRLDELPRSHQHPASLQQRFPASGMTSSGARSSAQAESGSVSAYSTHSLTRGKQCWGEGNDLVCDGAQPGWAPAAPRQSTQSWREGNGRSSSTATVSAPQPLPWSSPMDWIALSPPPRAPPGPLDRFLCSCSRARLTANVGA